MLRASEIVDNVFGNDKDTLIGDRRHCGSADNALIAVAAPSPAPTIPSLPTGG
ncbi:hypothetical protein AB0B25_14755 [Nocardia sp. NPDC049190]|uniref:hypothetical protein n=1 Tax=Nocardia sp. NPDC049190 TaxID=3155650 RepID=UPI0033E08B55